MQRLLPLPETRMTGTLRAARRCAELLLRAWDREGLPFDMQKEAPMVDHDDAKADRDMPGRCGNLRPYREHILFEHRMAVLGLGRLRSVEM
jgi:hypothetical protein